MVIWPILVLQREARVRHAGAGNWTPVSHFRGGGFFPLPSHSRGVCVCVCLRARLGATDFGESGESWRTRSREMFSHVCTLQRDIGVCLP